MTSATVLSIQVGLPKEFRHDLYPDDEDRTWTSGIFKETIEGAVELGFEHFQGDGQADLIHHGGTDRAVLIFPKLNYGRWESELGRELPPGAFGENLTIDTLTEDDVCLGDIWETPDVVLEVSQPRLPCFKLARRLESPGLNAKVMRQMAGGWYCRVLKPGAMSAGQELHLTSRPYSSWTIRRAFREYVFEKDNHEALAELAALPCLSQLWKDGIGLRS